MEEKKTIDTQRTWVDSLLNCLSKENDLTLESQAKLT
jgi:hypothetical protein